MTRPGSPRCWPGSSRRLRCALYEGSGRNKRIKRDYGYKLTRVLDVDVDGIPEILQPHIDGSWSEDFIPLLLEIYKRRDARRPDLLESVTDSLGAVMEISYAPMSDRSVYTPNASCTYPRHCPPRGRWLVREVRRSTAVAKQPMTTERHSYAGLIVDLAGRDWLGFSEHKVTNVERGSETTYRFDNFTRVGKMYPFAGLVQSEKTTFPPSGGKLHWIEKTSTYTNLATSSDRVLVRPEHACEFRYEATPPPGTEPHKWQPVPYVAVCTTYSNYDAYGSPRP